MIIIIYNILCSSPRPLEEAASNLHIGPTYLKHICRKKFNITSWPYRRIKSIQKTIQNLKQLKCLSPADPDEWLERNAKKIKELEKSIQDIKIYNANKSNDFSILGNFVLQY